MLKDRDGKTTKAIYSLFLFMVTVLKPFQVPAVQNTFMDSIPGIGSGSKILLFTTKKITEHEVTVA